MGRNKSGIVRDQRLQAIRSVLKNSGRLNKQQIAERLRAGIGPDAEKIETRTLYRDLEYLTTQGDVEKCYVTTDGSLIPEFDGAPDKTKRVEWAIKGQLQRIRGVGMLESLNACLQAPFDLAGDLSVESNTKHLKRGCVNFFFPLSHQFLRLSVDERALPITLNVMRAPDENERRPLLTDLQKKYGRRLALLQLPIPTLSSFRSPQTSGHFQLYIERPQEIWIQDCHSKNGTSTTILSDQEATEILEKGALLGERTVTSMWRPDQTSHPPETCPPGERKNAHLPTLIEASEQFRMLVIASHQ
ncbi:MAG: hypothetical protein HY537_06835 [Deltaproteobacteria bacterium]|nr:hypothetical protein [Deltaproteobacteria bacterium]